MKEQSRRHFLYQLGSLGVAAVLAPALSACSERVVEVEKTVEVPREVTRVVKEIVRETVLVERTLAQPTGAPTDPALAAQSTETALAAPKGRAQVVADVLSYGWTQLGIQMTPTFEEMFPHIDITWRSQSDWQSYGQYIAAQHASGQLGDLVEAPLGVLPIHWAQKQLIQPLDELMSADGFEYRSIFPGAMDACLYGGQHVALPFVCSGGQNLLLYRPDSMRESKIGEPTADWTLDDLEAAARELTRRAENGQEERYGHAVAFEMPGGYPMLRLFDAHLFSEDGRQSAVESDSAIACLGWARDQVLVQRTAPRPEQTERSPLDMLLEGRVAMVRHSLRTLVRLEAPDGERTLVEGILFPRHPSTGKMAAHISGMAYAITAKSQVSAEAFQWIKFVSSREMGVQMFLRGYAEPGCRMASWKDPRVLELWPLCSLIADAMVLAKPARYPWNLRVAQGLEAWNAGLRRLWQNDVSLAQVAQEMAKAIHRVLRQPLENLLTAQDATETPTQP